MYMSDLMSDSLLSSLQRLHAAAWNKGDNVSGVFARHPVRWDPGSNFADARLKGQKTVTVIHWESGVVCKQHLLEKYDVNAVLIRDEYSSTLREIIRCASADSEMDAVANFQSEIENPFRHQLPEFDMSGVSVTGTPGIGKSMFLIYVLVLRLLAGKPTFFRDKLSHGFLLDASGVSIVSSDALDTESQPEGTWFLVDSGQELESVTQDIITACRISNGFVIQSAPPRTPNFAWFTKIGNRMPWKIYMAPWSLEELIAGRDLQRHNAHLSEQQIKDFTEKFGTSARYVYGGAHTPSSHERLVKEKISILNLDIMKDLINVPIRGVKFDEYLSHLYLFNIPHPNDRKHCIMGIPTRYLTERVHEHLRRVHRVPTGDLYQYFVTNAFTGASAGYLLERLFFEQFPEGGEWPMKRMKRHFPSTKNVHWHYDEASTIQYLRLGWQGLLDIGAVSVGNIPPGAFQAVRRISFADGEQLTLDYAFYIPLSKSQVSFDAFVFTPGSVATIFQVTVKKKHEIKVDGLSWLENLGARYMDLVVVTCPNKEALGGCDDIKVVESHAHMLRNVYHLGVD
ncbi:hypothetical protein ACEPAI_1426 [Sanghuangporus weigelae]